ncbi:MAG TPA: AMP-binding protein [Puia sp.]|nr:AMP-binding protein [Puia sp.]
MEKAGWKVISDQCCSYPYIGHLHFGDKKDLLLPDHHEEELCALHDYLSRNRYKYRQFLKRKGRHPMLDLYACFQPFNEAFKALFPFVNYIRQQLKPGDKILNLWDRSGWMASMLAGWFPEQQIITVWEGDKDILGYKGFDYWMSAERRKNHRVFFADFLRPLPFENGTMSAIVGMDLLHRFHQPELLAELHRVARASAPIIFPHVHLTNNEPKPFFERGMRQLHGKEYDFLFSQLRQQTGRYGFVLSEPATFNWNDRSGEKKKQLVSEPDHSDYNACIAWLPSKSEIYLESWKGHEQDWENMYLLQNPLLRIDEVNHTIAFNTGLYGPLIEELLERHQVYSRRVKPGIGKKVEKDVVEVLYWALQGYTLKEILKKTNISKLRMQQILETVFMLELAQAVPVDESGFRLQTLLGHQKYIPESKEKDLQSFWKQAVLFYPDRSFIKSKEESLTYAEADEIIILLQKALLKEGLCKGDKILICGELHAELILVFWAAVSLGIIVVPVSSKESDLHIRGYINSVRPSIIFTDPSPFSALNHDRSLKVIMVDHSGDPAYQPEYSFDSWLSSSHSDETQNVHGHSPQPDDIAVILWTTGSTDNPKGIPLTHAQLIHSGRVMAETYRWEESDRYFALGGLESMSGLRHATVAIAETGACCVIPEKGNDIHAHYQAIARENITILTANPLFFKQLLFVEKGIGNVSSTLSQIRLALSTGNQLSPGLRIKWQQQTGNQLLNYYGLTETSGICIAEPPAFQSRDDRSIGLPVDCLVKIIDENGNEVSPGTKGELCIYGAGVFGGYYQNEKATECSLVNGWFHTKDIAMQNKDGSISLCGRLSDIVKLPSGQRIELSAIEEIMEQIPRLSDWAVCSVYEEEKESIVIFIIPSQTGNREELVFAIRKKMAERIGSYVIPACIETVDQIPRGNHNKVLRKQLLENYFQVIK